MLHKLTGTLLEKYPTHLVLDVQGLGFYLHTSLNTYAALPEPNCQVTLHTHLYFREEQLRLFGFATARERDCFQILLSIRGIGPSLALSILSSVTPHQLEEAIFTEDLSFFETLKGIGKKRAKRLLPELKEAFEKRRAFPKKDSLPSFVEDARLALVTLGYDEREAQKAIQQALPATSLEELIRKALAFLTKSQ